MTFDLTEFDIDDLSDEELAPIVDLINRGRRAESPRNVDLTVSDYRMFTANPGIVQRRFVVRDGTGDPVGFGITRFNDDGSNPETLGVRIRVYGESRRKGIGTLLLRNAVDIATDLGRTRLQSFHVDTVPAGAAFAEAIGATPVLEMHSNVLKIVDLDKELMKEWVLVGQTKTREYDVEVLEGRWPDEILDGMARLYYILDRDAPQEEGYEPREWTGEVIAQFLDVFLQVSDSLMALAVHKETKIPVGMSHLIRRHSDPTTWIVTATMVDPDHRGRSLGKWIKGAVNLAAIEGWEGGVYTETANAFANAPMLAINEAMGFRHEYTATEVAVSVDHARLFVESRP